MNLCTVQKSKTMAGAVWGPETEGRALSREGALNEGGRLRRLEGMWKQRRENSQFKYTCIARAGSSPHPPSSEDWFWGHRVNLISLSHVNFYHALPLSFCSRIMRSSPISALKNSSMVGTPQG